MIGLGASPAPSSAGTRRALADCGVSGAKFCDRKPEMLLAGGFMAQNLFARRRPAHLLSLLRCVLRPGLVGFTSAAPVFAADLVQI